MLPRARRPPPAPRISRGSVARPSMRRSLSTAPPENSAPPRIAPAPCAARTRPSQRRSHDHRRRPARWRARPRSEPGAGWAVLHDGAGRPGRRGYQSGEARHWRCVALASLCRGGGHRRLSVAQTRSASEALISGSCAHVSCTILVLYNPCACLLSLGRPPSPNARLTRPQMTRGAGARRSSARRVHTSFQLTETRRASPSVRTPVMTGPVCHQVHC